MNAKLNSRFVKILFSGFLFCSLTAKAQLLVKVEPVRIVGQKAIVALVLNNSLHTPIESARAAVFLTDEQGKMVGQTARWVIGGTPDRAGLAAGATNTFNFVITCSKPLTTTNLTAKVQFSRVVLEGGKLADVAKQVCVTPATE